MRSSRGHGPRSARHLSARRRCHQASEAHIWRGRALERSARDVDSANSARPLEKPALGRGGGRDGRGSAQESRLARKSQRVCRRESGHRGFARLERVVGLAEPATESPMETRLRMVLVLAGLPRPAVQVPIYDQPGRFLGRPDLYYATVRLGLEYDGASHRGSLASDTQRQNRLLAAGIRLLRFTAADVRGAPDLIVRQVRAVIAESQN